MIKSLVLGIENVLTALTVAILSLLTSLAPMEDPYFWSAFIASGDWRGMKD